MLQSDAFDRHGVQSHLFADDEQTSLPLAG